MRDAITDCTGDGTVMRNLMGGLGGALYEDDNDWCVGWYRKPYPPTAEKLVAANCTEADEFNYKTASELDSKNFAAGIGTYGGGGYVLEIKGYITDLERKLKMLQDGDWSNNRTRALFLEFSVYNAQVSLYNSTYNV